MSRYSLSREARAARRAQFADEALARATQSQALTNLPAVYAGFIDRGIPESEILPRVNVFTYAAWQALGRQVRRGEHGVRIVTYIVAKGAADPGAAGAADAGADAGGDAGGDCAGGDGAARPFKFPRTVTVFHVSQTDEKGKQ